jgi:hypothetical protein
MRDWRSEQQCSGTLSLVFGKTDELFTNTEYNEPTNAHLYNKTLI